MHCHVLFHSLSKSKPAINKIKENTSSSIKSLTQWLESLRIHHVYAMDYVKSKTTIKVIIWYWTFVYSSQLSTSTCARTHTHTHTHTLTHTYTHNNNTLSFLPCIMCTPWNKQELIKCIINWKQKSIQLTLGPHIAHTFQDMHGTVTHAAASLLQWET